MRGRAEGRHFRRSSRRWGSLRIGALFLTPACLLVGLGLSHAGSSALATVTGTSADTLIVSAHGSSHRETLGAGDPTVETVLRQARIHLAPGHLRAARSGRAIPGHEIPPRLRLDGVDVTLSTPVDGHHLLEVGEGVDVIETTIHIPGPSIPPPPLPAVEYGLYHPGVAGTTTEIVGAVSGERVSTTTTPATPPTPVTEKIVGLTFDDGPWPDTPQFLQVLHDKGVRAMFCMIGRQVPAMIDEVRQVDAAGMTICNHTVDHNMYLDRSSPDAVRADVQGGADDLTRALGRAPGFYRPPGGTLSPVIIEAAHRAGERVIHWTLDSMDYRRLGTDTIVARVVGRIEPGSIVLMHDGGGDRSQTLAALPRIIDALRAEGYAFATPDGVGPAAPPGPTPAPHLHAV